MTEHLAVVGVRLPLSVVGILDHLADRRLTSRSEVLRHYAIAGLQEAGLVERHDDEVVGG